MNIDEVLDMEEIRIEKPAAKEDKTERKPLSLNFQHPLWMFYLSFFALIGFIATIAIITAILIRL